MTGLISSLEQIGLTKLVMLLYMNGGGPDHGMTYLAVKVVPITLFRRLVRCMYSMQGTLP